MRRGAVCISLHAEQTLLMGSAPKRWISSLLRDKNLCAYMPKETSKSRETGLPLGSLVSPSCRDSMLRAWPTWLGQINCFPGALFREIFRSILPTENPEFPSDVKWPPPTGEVVLLFGQLFLSSSAVVIFINKVY